MTHPTRPAVVLPRRRAIVLAAVVSATVLLAVVATAFTLRAVVRDDPAPLAASASSSPPAVTAGIARMLDGRAYLVGTDVEPGLYRQASATPECVWIVTDAETGDEIARGIPGSGIATVNLGPRTRFASSGCGAWTDAPTTK